jgi:RNA polymerase sigma-70 factor, ECF subfamily
LSGQQFEPDVECPVRLGRDRLAISPLCSDSAAPERQGGVGIQREPSSGDDALVAIYPRALPKVYGYLLPRCGSAAIAEDLTTETFMAAVAATRRAAPPEVTVAWLIGVARHKLVDHWRRAAREERRLAAVEQADEGLDDPWDDELDAAAAHAALARLSAPQRVALTLRYVDGLPVAQVAEHLGRTLHATETLLVRARAALRRVYEEDEHGA